jgi:hypothetical protein
MTPSQAAIYAAEVFRQSGRASLLVNMPGDEMPLQIELVVLGVNWLDFCCRWRESVDA